VNRPLWLVAILLAALSVIPLSGALISGEIPGAGPDIVSTLWGMWWSTVAGPGALLGGGSTLANFPDGVRGALLAPSTAVSFALLEPLGAGRASALTDLLQLSGLAITTALLAARVGAGSLGALSAGLVILVGRYPVFCLGEASVVAIAAIGLPLGLIGLIDYLEHGRLRSGILLAACMAWVSIENPYLAPILPAAALVCVRRRPTVLLPLLGGLLGCMSVMALFSASSNPEYPFIESARQTTWLTMTLQVFEQPWAAAGAGELLWPGAVRWVEETSEATGVSGGRYLGLSVVLLSIGGALAERRRALPWVALAGGGVWLAMGSFPGGLPGPFLYFNSAMDALLRPVTQPTRYLVAALVGAGVLSGMATARLGRLAPAAVGLLVLEAVTLGGLSLALPTTPLPDSPCIAAIPDAPGGVLVWPWDGEPMVRDLPGLQLLQIAHGHPAAQPGIASWQLTGERTFVKLKDARFIPREEDGRLARADVDTEAIAAMGFRWLLVDNSVEERLTSRIAHRFPEVIAQCPDYTLRAVP
jgi:hypothetical protein